MSRPNLNAGYLDLNEQNSVLLEGAIINLANGFRIQAPNIAFKNAYQRTIKLIRENHKAQIPVTEIPTNLQALEKHKNFEFKQTSTPLEVNSSGPGHIDGGNVEGTGIKLKTKTKLSWKVGDIDLHSAQNIESSKRGNKTTLKVTHDSTELKVENGGISGEGENSQTFTGVKFEVDDQIHLKTENGPTSLLCDKNIDRSSESSTRKNLLFTTTRNRGHNYETVNMCESLSKGGMIVESKKGVYVEVKSGDLGNDPRTKWVLELRQNPTVMWKTITEQHQEWNKTQRTLTPAASAVFGLAIGIVTQGQGALLLGGLTGIKSAIANAAFTKLMTQTSLSLINNQGDLGKVFKELSSSKSLQSLATAMVTAGISKGLSLEIGLSEQAKGLTQHFQQNTINSMVSGVTSTIIEGGNLGDNLVSALKEIPVNTIASTLSEQIGNLYRPENGDAPKIDRVTHKALHGLVGGLLGGVLDKDDRLGGAINGAVSSIAVECLAEVLSSHMNDVAKELREQNPNMSLSQMSEALTEVLKNNANIAKLSIATVALLTGQNVNVAIETSKNALDNNHLLTMRPWLVAEGMVSLLSEEKRTELLEKICELALSAAESVEEFIDNEENALYIAYAIAGLGESDHVGIKGNFKKQAPKDIMKDSKGIQDLVKIGTTVVKSVIGKSKGRPKTQLTRVNQTNNQLRLDERSRVRLVNDRKPINSEYANKVYPLDKLPEELRRKYPHSVPFTGTGHPDFSRYAVKKVKVKMTGNRDFDEKTANKLVGFNETPTNYTWHHHHDGENMILIPFDIHYHVKHTGGVAIVKNKEKN